MGVTRNTAWSSAVQDLISGQITVPWFTIVRAELQKRGMVDKVLERGSEFLSDRKKRAVEFSQYCFKYHLNILNGSSADQLRRVRPFGIFPFMLSESVYNSRFIFSFLCSVWRYMDKDFCSGYPDVCTRCDQENSSFHVLFQCKQFESLRNDVFRPVGILAFDVSCLLSESRPVHRALVLFGRKLFYTISEMATVTSSPMQS
jgi:hypothetical protein